MVSKERSLDEKTQIVTTRLRDGRNNGKNPSDSRSKALSSCCSLLGTLGRKFRSSCCSSSSCLDDDASRAPAKGDETEGEKTNPDHEVNETARPSSSASALKTARDPCRVRQRRRTGCGDSTKPSKTQRSSRTDSGDVPTRLGEKTPLLRDSDRLRAERGARGQKKQNLERNLLTKEEKRTRYDDCRYGYPYFL